MGLRPDRRADITALISGSYGNFKSSCFHPAEHLPRFALPAHQRIDSHIRQARELDPVSLIMNTNEGWILFCGRDYDQTIEQL